MQRKNCPDCGADLGRNAFKCRCGWKAEEEKPAIDLDRIYADIRKRSHERWIEANKPTAEDSLELIRAYDKAPKPTPREHWERVLKTPGLSMISYEYAKAALKKSSTEKVQWTEAA